MNNLTTSGIMATKDIEKLLERYYDGLTSEGEEARIAGFFTDGDVPDSLKAEQDFFMALHAGKAAGRLDSRLNAQIDAWSKKSGGAGRHTARRIKMKLRHVCGIAASVLVVASLGMYLHNRTSITPEEQAALAQAQMAIVKFSATLNKGLDQMAYAQQKTEDLSRKINKCMELSNDGER